MCQCMSLLVGLTAGLLKSGRCYSNLRAVCDRRLGTGEAEAVETVLDLFTLGAYWRCRVDAVRAPMALVEVRLLGRAE